MQLCLYIKWFWDLVITSEIVWLRARYHYHDISLQLPFRQFSESEVPIPQHLPAVVCFLHGWCDCREWGKAGESPGRGRRQARCLRQSVLMRGPVYSCSLSGGDIMTPGVTQWCQAPDRDSGSSRRSWSMTASPSRTGSVTSLSPSSSSTPRTESSSELQVADHSFRPYFQKRAPYILDTWRLHLMQICR